MERFLAVILHKCNEKGQSGEWDDRKASFKTNRNNDKGMIRKNTNDEEVNNGEEDRKRNCDRDERSHREEV